MRITCNLRPLALAVVAAAGGCAGSDVVVREPVDPPSLEAIGNAPIAGLADEPLRFVDGHWQGAPYVIGGAARPTAGLADHFIRHGDLDGDGSDESVVLAWTSSGGSGTFNFIAVFGAGDPEPVNVATAALGDRVQLIDASVEEGILAVDVVQHDDEDPACCPGRVAQRRYVLADGRLLEQDVVVGERLSLQTLGGVDWILVSMGSVGDDVPEGTTLRFDGIRISGHGPCNRYFTQAVPGRNAAEFSVERIGATRMYCGDEIMQTEDAYFQALAASQHFSFVAGELAVNYRVEGVMHIMLFDR